VKGVKEACQQLVDELKAAGFPGSSLDPETVDPPAAVWVQPRTIHDLTMSGGATLTVWLYVLGSSDDTAVVMGKLDDALEGLLELGLTFADDETPIDLTAAVLLPGRNAPLPAYRLAVDLDL
jgi:hypothetical protein